MQTMQGTIAVGVDGSESAARALTWAVTQAMAEHRALTLVHAVPAVAPEFIGAGVVEASNARRLMEDEGRTVLAAAHAEVQRTAPGLDVHQVFELLDPREVLLRVSESASMVVVGSRGRGHVRSLLLGSVSVAMVRHAHCPVVVVRPGNRGTVRNGILLGLDVAPESRPVLEFAYRQASLRELPLTVLDCAWDALVWSMGAYLVPDPGETDVDEQRLLMAESLAGMGEKYPDVTVTRQLAHGLPQTELAGLADRMDLIVVGAHQESRMSQALFGSVSVSVVEAATCPVAVVPVSTVQ
jgi:nucleotide-binding universal stress UspA family protein